MAWRGRELEAATLWSEGAGEASDYCCLHPQVHQAWANLLNTSHPQSDNSTFLEVLGKGCFHKWREVRKKFIFTIFFMPCTEEKKVR